MCSLRGVNVITLAAIFCKRCSLRSKFVETPDNLVFHAQRGVVHNPKILCSCIWRYQTTIDGDRDAFRQCQPLFRPKGNHLCFVPI